MKHLYLPFLMSAVLLAQSASAITPTAVWTTPIVDNNYGTSRQVGRTTSGDVVVATKITTSGSGGNLRVTRHSGSTGLVLWTRDIDSGNSNDSNEMIVDPATGNAYLAANATNATSQDWYIYKVNGSSGALDWTYSYNGTANLNDRASDLALTSDGNLVVCGEALDAPSNINFARVVKLNTNTGGVIWSYQSTRNFSGFNGIATDGSGNVYVVGNANETTTNQNGITLKLNSAGGPVWEKTFDGTAGLLDSFTHVALDSNGDCIAGGITRITTTPNNSDAVVLKYVAADGALAWTRQVTGAANESETLTQIITNGTNIYIGGVIRNTPGDRTGYVRKLLGDGTTSWTYLKDGAVAGGTDRLQGVRFFNGAVYAAGQATNTANTDILVVRINDSDGSENWSYSFNGSTNGADDLFNGPKNVLTVLADDAVVVAGESFNTGTSQPNGVVFKTGDLAPVATAPTVSTATPTTISHQGAVLGGNVTSDGGASVTERGIVWATTPSPTTANNKVANGSGTGTFSATVNGMAMNTLIYVRAYATNSVNTSYGNEVSFTTLGTPTLTSLNQSGVTATAAILGATVTSAGGLTVLSRGVVYAPSTTNANPTLGGFGCINVDTTGTLGAFTVPVSGLTPGTQYSYAAYATNSLGAANTPASTFTTNLPLNVTSLNRVNSTPTKATTVNWTLTFPSATTGLTAGNFTLTGAAAAGLTVGTPTTSNNITWNIPVTTGSTDGLLTLSLTNDTGLSASYVVPFNGQSYTIDKTPPTVVSVTRLNPTGQNTNLTTMTFRVTYSEPVTLNAPATSRFQVVPVNGSTIVGTVTGVTGTGNIRDVTVNLASGVGEFRLRVVD